MTARTRPRVFRRLLEHSDLTLRPRTLSKGTLTELSHVLENAVIEHDLPGAVFTGFQESANWLPALARYRRLVEPKARSVAVFAAGNLDSIEEDDILRIELGEDGPLREEWFLIVLTTGFSVVLLGEETGEPFESELERRFDSIWSFDANVVTTVTRFIRDEVATFDHATAARIDAALATFAPGPHAEGLRDEVLGDIISALERSRMRLAGLAQMEQRVADELRDLDRTKNAFLSAVSHELRTPLTVVHGMAMTLRRLGTQLSEDDRVRVETALVDQADRLSMLLNDLLDVDRMTRGTLPIKPERFDVTEVIRKTVEDNVQAQGLARLDLVFPDLVEVTVDRTQFERILVNLVENAFKYAPTGSITIEVARRPGSGIILAVTDDGPGIPMDKREQVFEPFYRIDDDHPQPGTGIGLSLVAEFSRLHGGSAVSADPQGRGARIVVELPDQDLGPTPGRRS